MKWEYLVIKLSTLSYPAKRQRELNQYGVNGWELVHIESGDVATFKRPLPTANPASEKEQ